MESIELRVPSGRPSDAAYDSSSTATISDDLQAAFVRHLGAAAFFASLSAQNRYAVLFRLQTAWRGENRAAKSGCAVPRCAKSSVGIPGWRPAGSDSSQNTYWYFTRVGQSPSSSKSTQAKTSPFLCTSSNSSSGNASIVPTNSSTALSKAASY